MADLDEFARRLRHPKHLHLFDYWRSKAPAGRLPGRADIDPVDLPAVLPWIVLYDVHWADGQPGFRFRLVGTGVVHRYGRDATGQRFEDAYEGEILARQMAVFSEVATTGQPHVDSLSAPIAGKEFLTTHRLILPLSADGRTVDHLIALILFDETRPGVGAIAESAALFADLQQQAAPARDMKGEQEQAGPDRKVERDEAERVDH